MSLRSGDRFESSASIIVFGGLGGTGGSFPYIKSNSGPRRDPCGTPHVALVSQLVYTMFITNNHASFYL